MFAQSKSGNYSLTNGASGVADAIDFDGVTDYLSRSSDLVGNADGKTFTFSAWVWRVRESQEAVYTIADNLAGTNASLLVRINSTSIVISASGASTFTITATLSVPFCTFTHILFSASLNTTPATASLYINDSNVNFTRTGDNSGFDIDFTKPSHMIGMQSNSSVKLLGRLSKVYLDYTYRDLSVEANRRLFITADRKPAAGQSALNPILYLPLNDPTQPGKNYGTGGDFALNGVVARSGRGPSQFNAPYSDLDGSADYLSRTSALSGAVDGKQFVFSCVINFDAPPAGTPMVLLSINSGGSARTIASISADTYEFSCGGYDSAGTQVFRVTSSIRLKPNRNYVVSLSTDLTNVSKRKLTINGVDDSPSWAVYDNSNINFSAGSCLIGSTGSSLWFNGRLGNVFFDTRYIDLSQPDNLAKFVTGTGIDAKPADLGANGEKPFGTPPLIYLPMYGNNAGKNYGTGGDFTVNSGPFTGARGPNEFWGNKADFNGSTGYLARTSALTGVSDGKTFSCSFWFSPDDSSLSRTLFRIGDLSAPYKLWLYKTNANTIQVFAYSASGVELLSASFGNYVAGTSVFVNMSFDMSDAGKRNVFVNGSTASPSFSTYTDGDINFSYNKLYFGTGGGNFFDGKLSEFYFTTEYIDFSQEANRLKFRDAFGNPVDLAPQIAAGTLPNPAIYMRFDPANFGKNSGTGGDFVVNGTITDGGQL